MEVLKLFAPYGPGWLGGAALVLIAFYFGRQFLAEYKVQNERKANLDLKREERKQAEVDERAQRDRDRSQMEGRIAAQMERSNTLIEGMKTLMESVVASNDVLHADLVNSQSRSQGMAEQVSHIRDRVDLLYDKEPKVLAVHGCLPGLRRHQRGRHRHGQPGCRRHRHGVRGRECGHLCRGRASRGRRATQGGRRA